MGTAAGRIVRVLEVLAREGRPLSVTEIGLRLGTDKSAVSRLLRDLERHGVLEREDPRGRFRLGLRLAHFARTALQGTELRAVSAPHLRQLCAASQESVHLAIFRNDQVIYIDKVEAPAFVRTSTEIGDLAPPHCTASGKAILAWLPEPTLRRWLRGRRLARYTARTLTRAAALVRHLHDVRTAGHALDDEEYVPDVRCLAAPILNHAGQVVASVGVSGLATRLAGPRLHEVAALVERAAAAISAALGLPGRDGVRPAPPAEGARASTRRDGSRRAARAEGAG